MKIRKSAFVFHSQEAIFDLVDDVESYPQFLPWCGSTDVHLKK
jgi:ribosome-associated toxin RatA of RatAB toxin-antitoxin module